MPLRQEKQRPDGGVLPSACARCGLAQRRGPGASNGPPPRRTAPYNWL